MYRRNLLPGCFALLVAVSSVQAGVVALKRSPGLTDGRGLASTFSSAITGGTITVHSGQSVIGDAYLYTDTGWAQSLCYVNSGAVPAASSNAPILVKCDLSLLPGLLGGKVNKAELRFYATGGNSGMSRTGYVTTSNWSEGNKTAAFWGYGDFPGKAPAAPGVSGAHPNGLNTDAFQDANGVSKPGYFASWASGQMFAPSKDGVILVTGVEYNPWGVTAGQWDQYLTIDVTPILNVWANGTPNYGFVIDNVGGNYGPYLSEETANPDWQPILFVDYLPHGNPTTISNLTAGNPDWFKLDLTWTAPSANPPAPVASYDIRMSTSAITDDASFAAATRLTTVPIPGAPGTVEHLTVNGLTAATTYYFAIKSTDIVGTVSTLSNVASGTTSPMDVTAPAQITTLAAPNVKPNYAVLTWTAVGDDGAAGLAAGYEMRYSTAPLNEGNFASATLVSTAAPKAPGLAETITVHGLMPSTTYYFAIKAKDEVPNTSLLSNVVSFATQAEDLLPPQTTSDLAVSAAQINVAFLTWTAPADQGPAGMAGYDLRYSTSPITDANWSSATPVTGEPIPAASGAQEICMVAGLSASTTYYFAMKSFDYAEPANVSVLSNVATATTMPPIVPVTVHNPWLKNDRVADTHNITTMAATYVNAYTPAGVVITTDPEQKAINLYNNQKRRLYHWADQPPNAGGFIIEDPTYTQNVFGWALCGRHGAMGMTLAKYAGFSDTRNVGIPGHNIYEVFYNNGWHLYDTMTTMYCYTKTTPRHIACLAEISADHSLTINAVADGRACPGFLLCGDDATWYADNADHWGDGGHTVAPTAWNGNMDLRLGQSFKRTWESWLNQHPTPYTNADGAAGNDPPYHHEANKDWKDTVNYPYWEPYQLTSAQSTALNIPMVPTFRRWANGTDTLVPDFKSAGYQAMLESSSHDIAANFEDSLTPDLHAKTVNTTGEAVFKISVPFYITDANFSGDFVKVHSGDLCSVFVSADGSSWTQVWTASALGTTHVANQSLRSNVFGLWQTWYIKVQLKGTVAKGDAGVSNFVVTTTFEHNKGAMAYLDKGVNNITLTFDNAAELQASRNVVHVVYKWKEFDGTDWTVDKNYEGWFAASPSTFTIATSGAKVPRTEYVLMEVVAPPLDMVPPGQITTLAAGTPTFSKVPLTWTATGDDGSTGTAMAYDLRYSSSPITDDATFNAATQVAGVPAPKVAGSSESFNVTGLAGGTTYYFAIKAVDKGTNRSPLSNMATATTTVAVGVTNLAVGTVTSSKVALTWTALDDGNTGSEASYDLRYSTSPITDSASFNAAMRVTGMPAPKPAGSSESFAITGLSGSTTYYFAIKGIDGSGNPSPLSNIVSATTAVAARVSDLAGSAGSNKVRLTWTAIDDGNTGTEASYDLRYSTNAITDDASFNAATAVTGVSAPKAAGGSESFTVTGLTASTTYSFAIKAIDSFGIRSPLSNVVTVTTTPADVVAPGWIGNLVGKPSKVTGGVDLTWTAPADYGYNGAGPFTCASYELRYSSSPILYNDGDATWTAATQVTGLPAPKAPGSAESFTVSGLTAGTTYYFAIKAKDDSNNVSQVSNCAPSKPSVIGELTLQTGLNGYTGTMDTYIDTYSGSWSTNERMTLCGYADPASGGIGNVQRGLIKFDLASVPAGTTVGKATLSLYAYDSSALRGSSGFYGAFPLTRSWTDSQTTWTNATSSVTWTTIGGDFLAAPDGTSAKQNKVNVWYNFDVTTRVQSWLAGTSGNYGWMIKCVDEENHNQDRMYQSDTGNAAFRPKLAISDLVTFVAGDINRDTHVDVIDLLSLANAWGTTLGVNRTYDPLCDLNGDGSIDVVDLLFLADNWGH